MFGRLMAAAAALLMVSAMPASADAGPEDGNFYISPMGSYLWLPPKFGYTDDDYGWGGALGMAFNENWAAELAHYRYGGTGSSDVDNTWANLLYLIPTDAAWQPYVTIGGGKGNYKGGTLANSESVDEYNFGVGAFFDVSERVSLRSDFRGVYLDHRDKDLRPFAAIGVAVTLGKLEGKTPADSDGDGVPDGTDKCPGTPPGRRVDATGCELDSDGDGVVDGVDACPNTPKGVAVDSRGCPPDSDGDGVPDYLDQCPNTPRGTKVDEKGCPIVLKEPVTFNLTVEFAYDAAVINDLSFRELRRAMQFLRDHPSTKAVIEGHTDNRGTDAYNQGLSQRRAAAVVDVLTRSGIEAGRLSAVGYGESRPIASNDTDEGRQRNRRVSIVVSE